MAILKKITKLKNLGVYADFSWVASLPEFKQYNVIYGWNGTGKTTLSKLLGLLSTGNHPDFPSLEYQVQDSDGVIYTNDSAPNISMRVFNSDFIVDNIDFERLSSKTITVILGKENKEALKTIEDDEKELVLVKENIRRKIVDKQNKEIAKGLEFTNIAKVIGQVRQGGIVRTYNKTHAEQAFVKLANKELLDEAALEKLSSSVAQPSLPKQNEISLGNVVKDLYTIAEEAKYLLEKTVKASVIGRLKEYADISEWVEMGIKIHSDHKSESCEFCGKHIDSIRLDKLADHFNEADSKLKTDIDNLINRLVGVFNYIKAIDVADKMNIYQELRDDYVEKSRTVISERDTLLEVIKAFGKLIRSKKLHTTEKLDIEEALDATKLVNAVKDLNAVIIIHNEKTNNFVEKQKSDSAKIESHHLSTILDTVHKLDDHIKTLGDEITALINGDDKQIGINKLTARITENKAKISSSHRACEILNTSLKKFIGHDEITFTVNNDNTGYAIMRRGNPAKSLSEGERTAISFIFFATQLKDDNFDSENGIIVVDDPVSSLDANSQYQAFSFLKESTKNASQLFVFTHNFDFLKLVLNWVKNSRRNYSLFMVKNSFSETDGSRTAYLDRLDEALEKYESEYHYLFNLVHKYRDDGTIENAYKIPNIARKLLDSFLMFRIPKNETTFDRLKEIKYDEEKKTAIYKFVNDQSHITGSGFDPSLVPEAKKCIIYLLDMMKTVDPEHCRYLEEMVV